MFRVAGSDVSTDVFDRTKTVNLVGGDEYVRSFHFIEAARTRALVAFSDGRLVRGLRRFGQVLDDEVVEPGRAAAVLTQDNIDTAYAWWRRAMDFDAHQAPVVGAHELL